MVGRPLGDAELVEQAQRGETAAYEALVHRHQQIAFRTAYLPNAVAVAPDGTFYVAEFAGRRVRRVDGRTGVITTIAR